MAIQTHQERETPASAADGVDLLRWIDEPRAGVGINFARDDGGWDLTGYDELAAQARRVAVQVMDGTSPGSAVCVALPTGPEFISSFFGILWAGRTACPLAPPNPLRGIDAYRTHVIEVLATARPQLVLAAPDLQEVIAEAAREADVAPRIAAPVDDSTGAELPQRESPAPFALLQFTSGSSGAARGVQVSHDNLGANIGALLQSVQPRPSEEVATWLPLFHDMGLIGCMGVPVTQGLGMRVLSPEQFIRDPARWLDCFGRHGCSLTAAPSFGFGYAAKRVRDKELAGTDFSGWRVAICGAERVSASVLRDFAERLGPHGFSPRTFLPAYGLAEGTLAVTGVDLDEVPRAVRVEPSSLATGEPVTLRGEHRVDEPEVDLSSGSIVSCGTPVRGTSVEIYDDDGNALGEGRLGEIVVRGESVAQGYAGDPATSSTRFVDDALWTGDAGFVRDGELFVLGRMGDSVSVRGRTVFVEELEARLAGSGVVPRGRSVVLAGVDGSRELVAALAELEPGDWANDAATLLVSELGPEADVVVGSLPRGGVERTTGGKPRRRPKWEALVGGTLEMELVWSSSERTEDA